MNIEVNYSAVLAASITSMVIGFAWYSPMILGNQWMKEKGFTKESLKKEQKEMGKLYGVSFIVSLITAYILSYFMTLSQNFYEQTAFSTGITTVFELWLGFMMPVQTTATIFGNKNWRLFAIDTGYQLVSIMAMGVVIGLI